MHETDSSSTTGRIKRRNAGALSLVISALSLIYAAGLVPTFEWMRDNVTARVIGFLIHTVLLMFGLGMILLKRRPSSAAKAVLALVATLTAIAANVALIQVTYEIAPITAGWRSEAPKEELNGFGFRGQTITVTHGQRVVLLLGDSQVEALAGSVAQMPETRLEFHLKNLGIDAKAFSLGAAGYGQDQQLFALREYLNRHSADVVALWFTPGNDIFPTHMPRNGPSKPTFRLAGDRLITPELEWGEESFTSPIKAVALVQRARSRALFERRDDHWEKFLPKPYQSLTTHTGPVDRTWENTTNHLSLIVEDLDSEKSHFSIWMTPPSPRMEYGIRLTRALLTEIETIVEANGARLVLFHAPQPPRTDGAEKIFTFRGKYYRASESQISQTLDRVLAGFDRVNLPVQLDDWRVSETGLHLNPAANDDTMRRLANELAARLKQPSQTPE